MSYLIKDTTEEGRIANHLCCQIPDSFICKGCKNGIWVKSRSYKTAKQKHYIKLICQEMQGVIWQAGINLIINDKEQKNLAEQEIIEDCSLYQPIN